MSLIQRSTTAGPLSAEDARVRLRNAPKWFVTAVDKAREKRGLALICPHPRPAVSPRHPRAAPSSALAPSLRFALPKVALVLAPGVGTITAGRRELFEAGAWSTWHSLAKRGRLPGGFTIRDGGHRGPIAACRDDGSLAFTVDPVAGPIVIWQPNGHDARHRAIVESIWSGRDAISSEFHALALRWDRGIRRISMAMATGVAILRPGESPAFRGAMAGILDGKKPLRSELRRLVDAALVRAQGK
jgi:hypothetical protein